MSEKLGLGKDPKNEQPDVNVYREGLGLKVRSDQIYMEEEDLEEFDFLNEM